MFEFGGYGEGSPEMGGDVGGNAYSGFNDYYNQMYPDQWSRAYSAQQQGGRTMFTDPPQNQQPGMPQKGNESGPPGKGKTTPFGQWESLSNFTQGGPSNMPQFGRPQSRGVQDMDYATFLRFMSQIGPMLFGAGRGQNAGMP